MYEKKRQKLDERHQGKIAAVVDEWDEAESRYKKMKSSNLVKAQEKMRSKLIFLVSIGHVASTGYTSFISIIFWLIFHNQARL